MLNFSLPVLCLMSFSVPLLSVSLPPQTTSLPEDRLESPVELPDLDGQQLKKVDDLPDSEWYEIANYITREDKKIDEDMEDSNNDELYETLFSVLDDYIGGLLLDYASNASPSDAVLESACIPCFDEIELQDDEDPGLRAVYDSGSVTNVLAYTVRIDGSNYNLYLSPDDIDRIYIDSNNYLWNVGTSQITGRLFSGSFNPRADSGMIMYLQPSLGNNFSNNHNYGTPNYYRNYYWTTNGSGNRVLTYSTRYCTIQVTSNPYPLVQSMVPYFIIIFLVGVMLVCLLRR